MSTRNISHSVEPLKVSQVIRSKTLNNVDLPVEAREDVKASIFQDQKNNIDFYNIQTNIRLPKKLIPKQYPQTYKSVHRLVECKATKQLAAVFKEKEPNALEKEALSEIKKEKKVPFLPDLYKEFNKENIPTKQELHRSSRDIASQIQRTERKEVEDLDHWTQANIEGVKIKHDREIEDLRNEVGRMMLFAEDDFVNQRDKVAVDVLLQGFESVKKKAKAKGMGEPGLFGREENPNELPMINTFRMSKFISKTPKARLTNNFKGEMGFGGMADLAANQNEKIDVKTRISYYKGMHEETESQLNQQIKSIEGELSQKRELIARLGKEISGQNWKIKQIIQKIEAWKAETKKRKELVKVMIPPTGLSLATTFELKERLEAKEIEEREIMEAFKEELAQARKDLEVKERKKKEVEDGCPSLEKKLDFFRKIKMKLYLKILKHGFDCREEGLIWVLKDLIREGENITYDDFPDFLDTGSRAHLLQKGKLFNELSELKNTERALIGVYQSTYEKKFYLSKPSNVFEHNEIEENNEQKAAGNPTKLHQKKKSCIVIKSQIEQMEEVKSLNDLGLEEEQETTEEKFIRKSEKAKTVKINAPEKKSTIEKSTIFQRSNTTQIVNLPSLTNLSSSRLNVNESAYHDAKMVISQIIKEEDSTKQDLEKKKKSPVQFKIKLPENNSLVADCKTKEEFLAKIHDIQAKINTLRSRIFQEDQKEGLRIVKEYDVRKMRTDLEFYLTAVIGLAQAEKFYYRYT